MAGTTTAVVGGQLLVGDIPPRAIILNLHPAIVGAEAPGLLANPDDRFGSCYELAATWIALHWRYQKLPPGSVLVHGSIQGLGYPRIGHAWLELERDGVRFVHDPVSLITTSPDHWAEYASAETVVRYEPEDVIELLLATANFGPWHQRPFGTHDCAHGYEYERCSDPRCQEERP